MVKNFRGEVKISDVKNEFDNLVDRINNMVDSYNYIGKVEDIDYSVGGVNLSPAGYTLTVGGLKQGLNSVDRNVIGAKCFKVNGNKFKVTDGLVLTKKGAVRLPDTVVTKPSNYHTLYFNTITNSYQWVGGSDYKEETKVAKLNSNNKYNPDTGYYYLEHGKTPFNLFPGSGDLDANFPLYDPPIVMDEVTVDTPRFITDSSSLVRKLLINLPDYQYVNLPSPEVKITDIVIECDCPGGFAEFSKFCSGVLFGKYTPDDTAPNENSFDPRLAIRNHFEYHYSSGNFELRFADATKVSDASRFWVKKTGGVVRGLDYASDIGWNPGQLNSIYSVDGSISRPIANDIIKYKITIEEHHEKLMLVLEYTLGTMTWDHYDGDLYANANTKFSDNHMYMFIQLGDNYKDMTVGNIGLLAAGNSAAYGIGQDLYMNNKFDPNVIKVCNNRPVTEEANIYYTVLTSTGESEDVYKICDINMNRDSKFVSDINTIQVEKFNGKYNITSESKTFGSSGAIRWSSVSRDNNEAIFISGIDSERFEREGTSQVYLVGERVAWNSQPGHRNLNYWTPVNMLYVPKGIDNPFLITNGDASKSFKVIIDKKVE